MVYSYWYGILLLAPSFVTIFLCNIQVQGPGFLVYWEVAWKTIFKVLKVLGYLNKIMSYQ